MKAYVTPHDFPNLDKEREILSTLGIEIEEINSTDPQVIGDKARDGVALFVQYTKINAETIEKLDQCKIILRYGIGFDNVDLEAAGAKGIYVCNVPSYCGEEVADHTLSLLLAASRNLLQIGNGVRQGSWSFLDQRPIYSLSGKVLGLIGCGNIAQKVAKRAQAFGMQIVTYDPWLAPAKAAELGIIQLELEQLCEQSDYISLHVPMTPETYHLVDAKLISQMKDGVILINTARGGLVNEHDVYEALKSGKVGTVCLDVLEIEPPDRSNSLIGMERAIITPHVAYYSETSLPRLQELAAEEVVRVLTGEKPHSPVNLKWFRQASS